MENPRRDQFIRIAMARLFTEYPFEPQRLAIASKMYSRWVDRKKKNKTKMRQERLRYSLWKCELCNDTFITDSKKRWSIVGCKCGKTSVDDEEWYSRYIGKPKLLQQSDKLLQQSDKLRELFPNYVGNPSIEIYEDGDSSKVVTYLNVPENRIEILYSNWDESSGQWIGDIDGTTLDDVDDTEFEILIKGIINQSKDD